MARPTFLMLLLLAGAMGAPLPALAQVVTTFQDNTPLYSSQINSAFGQAVNTQSGTATNLTVNGGTLSGPTISGQVQGAPTFANQSGWLTSLGAASATALANILNGTTPFTALTATGGGSLGGTFAGAGNLSTQVVTPPSAPNSQTLSQTAVPLGFVDARDWIGSTGDTCATNMADAIAAAQAAGIVNLWFPAGCHYTPPSNTIPSGLDLLWQRSLSNPGIISVANRATDQLDIGAESRVRDVDIISLFCDATAAPAGTQKECHVDDWINASNGTVQLNTWGYAQSVLRLGTFLDPNGVSTQGNEGPTVLNFNQGADAFYASTQAMDTNAYHASTNNVGGGDNGLTVEDGGGDSTTTDAHNGVTVNEDAYNANGHSIWVQRKGNGTGVTVSLSITDAVALGSYSTDWFDEVMSNQTGGDINHISQSGAAFTGTFYRIDAGVSPGTFLIGKYFDFYNNGTEEFFTNQVGWTFMRGGWVAGHYSAHNIDYGITSIQNEAFANAGDAQMNTTFQEIGTTSGASIVLTSDGSGVDSASNCGNIVTDNTITTLKSVTVTAKDATTPANDYSWTMSEAMLNRYTGVGSTRFHGGTPVIFSDGSVAGAGVSVVADTINACPQITFTTPTGNADTWHVQATFSMDLVQ